jgi:hypothetical protein
MGTSYFSSARERREYEEAMAQAASEREAEENARIDDGRRRVAAKIVMAVVDKVVKDIIRPGPHPEERECYEVAGEVRAMVPDLEALVKQVLDAEDGVE